jgi:hypothetical protein
VAERVEARDAPAGNVWSSLESPRELRAVGLSLVARAFEPFGFTVVRPDPRTNVLVARRGREELEVHVRLVRERRGGAPFWPKDVFDPRAGLYACAVLLEDRRPPKILLVPSEAWLTPDEVLRDLPNPRGKSPPEWRLNTSPVQDPALEAFGFDRIARGL